MKLKEKMEHHPLEDLVFGVISRGDFPKILKSFHKEGIRINNINNYRGYDSLQMACVHLRTKTVKFLLEIGVHIGKQYDGNFHPLFILCRDIQSPTKDIIKLFLERKIGPNITDSNGNTPLHYTSSCGAENENIDISRMLLEFGANINSVNNRKETPLICCSSGHKINYSHGKLLLEYGADPNLVDFKGNTFFDYLPEDKVEEMKEFAESMFRNIKPARRS